jgi:heat shock protein HtpX
MLRVLLFFGTNIAIMIVLSISIRLLGLGTASEQKGDGLNLNVLLIFSAIFGMSGSLISLVISKWIAKKTMVVKLIEMPTKIGRNG